MGERGVSGMEGLVTFVEEHIAFLETGGECSDQSGSRLGNTAFSKDNSSHT